MPWPARILCKPMQIRQIRQTQINMRTAFRAYWRGTEVWSTAICFERPQAFEDITAPVGHHGGGWSQDVWLRCSDMFGPGPESFSDVFELSPLRECFQMLTFHPRNTLEQNSGEKTSLILWHSLQMQNETLLYIFHYFPCPLHTFLCCYIPHDALLLDCIYMIPLKYEQLWTVFSSFWSQDGT